MKEKEKLLKVIELALEDVDKAKKHLTQKLYVSARFDLAAIDLLLREARKIVKSQISRQLKLFPVGK